VVITLSSTAAAQGAAKNDEERARLHYGAGREHYENGRYEAAITEFEASYAASPRPELRYNLYLAHERLGQFDRALGHLEAYLAEGKLEPAERDRLIARRDALRQRAGTSTAPPASPDTMYGPPPRPPESRSNFLLRLGIGPGYANADSDLWRVYGGTGGLMLTAGYRIAGRLILHASFWGASMLNPKIQGRMGWFDGVTVDVDATYASAAVGLGVTWRFPRRFHASATLGAASVTSEQNDEKVESDPGPALMLSGGKEWRLGGSWAAGLALSFTFQSIPSSQGGTILMPMEEDNPFSVFLFSVMGTIAYD
jgi:hypothetical protein